MAQAEMTFDRQSCAVALYRWDDAARPIPCIVIGNGIALTRNARIPDHAKRVAAAGFAVLAFDYRHCGDSHSESRSWVSLRHQPEGRRAAVDGSDRS